MARFNRANTPLFEPTVAFLGGILSFSLTDRGSVGGGPGSFFLLSLIVLGAALSVVLLVKYFGNQRIATWRRIGVWSLFFIAGSGLTALRRVDPSVAVAHHGERLTCLGRVESLPQLRGRWVRSTATLLCYADSTNGDWMPLDGLKITLYTDTSAHSPRPQIGDLVRLRGRLYAADSTGYDLYMRRTRGISGRYFARTLSRITTDTTFRTRIELFRNALGARLLSPSGAPPDDAGRLMQALATGDQSEIDLRLRESYTRSGTAHLLAVSGLHVGIIFVIINLLFGWVSFFRCGPVVLGIAVILCLGAYAVLTGLSPSVVRAVVMFSLLQGSLMLSRYTNGLNTLCAAALVIAGWNPYYVYHIGFQLSFAAVVGILTLGAPLARLWMPRYVVLRWLWSLTLVGATAQIATLPLVLYHFGQIQYAGLLLNPVIWFTVPTVIGGSLLYLASGWEWVYALTHRVAEWQNAVVGWTADRSWAAAVEGVSLSSWGCALLYGGIIALIVWINRVSRTKTRAYFFDPTAPGLRRAAK